MWLLDKILGKKKEAEISESEKSKSSEDDTWNELETLKERIERLGKTDSEVYRDLSALQSQKFEVPRRIQIMQESAIIIEETNNIVTLLTRKKVIDEELAWFRSLEKQNSPFHLHGGVEAKQNDLDFRFNEMVFRVAQNVFDSFQTRIEELKMSKAKQILRAKTLETMEMCEDALIKYPDNFKEYKTKLAIFYGRLIVVAQDSEIRMSQEELKKYVDYAESITLPEDAFMAYLGGEKVITIDLAELKKKQEEHLKYQENWKAFLRCSELDKMGMQQEKEGSIDEAIKTYEQNIAAGYVASHAYNRLMVLYRKANDYINEIRVLKRYYEVYKLPESDLEKDIKRIEDKHKGIKPVFTLPKEPIIIPEKKELTLGSEYESIQKKLPQFNFYNDKPESQSTNDYLCAHGNLINDHKFKPQLWNIQKKFKGLIEQAQGFEKDFNLASASIVYEQMINQFYYMPAPYDRLSRIYAKANLIEHEKRVLNIAITFFTALRERQKEWVLLLAGKVGKSEYCQAKIDNNEKIFYYGGSFELYNPFIIMDKWKERLKKLS